MGLALTACLTVLPTATATTSAPARAVAWSGAGLGRYYHQRLDWRSCVPAPALIVAATGDPRTPYTGSVALRGLLPSSRLITLEGADRHTVYGTYGNACVDDRVHHYLATGRLPAEDSTCAVQGG